MTATLSQTQSLFQNRLLNGAPEIKEHLVDGGPFLEVYDRAYKARLLEVMAEDFPGVHTLLGDEEFAEAASAYLDAHPSAAKSIRWIGRDFTAWLKDTPPWRHLPMLADMAAFEWALGLAFDAADAPPITTDNLTEIPPEAWPHLQFQFHPALNTAALAFDVVPFRQAVATEREPEAAPEALVTEAVWAVWRDPETLTVQYRLLGEEEAVGLAYLTSDGTFAGLCEVFARFGPENSAAVKAAGYLKNWIEAGWITAFTGAPMSWANPS